MFCEFLRNRETTLCTCETELENTVESGIIEMVKGV